MPPMLIFLGECYLLLGVVQDHADDPDAFAISLRTGISILIFEAFPGWSSGMGRQG